MEFSRIFRKSLIFYPFVLDEKILNLSGSNGGFFRKSQMFLPFSRQKNFQVEEIGTENFKKRFSCLTNIFNPFLKIIGASPENP